MDNRPDDCLTGGVSSVVNKFRPWSKLIKASVDFLYFNRRVIVNDNGIYLYALINLKPSK